MDLVTRTSAVNASWKYSLLGHLLCFIAGLTQYLLATFFRLFEQFCIDNPRYIS